MVNTSKLQKQIIREAMNAFRLYGIKSTLVDTIAAGLQISKKTLYEHFSGKQELLCRCILEEIDRMKAEISAMEDDGDSSLGLILGIDNLLFREALTCCPAFFRDVKLQREALKIIDEQLRAWVYSVYLAACGKAVSDGSIVPECNFQFVFSFLSENLRSSYANRQQYPAEELKEVHRYTTYTYLSGVCTAHGRAVLEILAEKKSNKQILKLNVK